MHVFDSCLISSFLQDADVGSGNTWSTERYDRLSGGVVREI